MLWLGLTYIFEVGLKASAVGAEAVNEHLRVSICGYVPTPRWTLVFPTSIIGTQGSDSSHSNSAMICGE